MLYPFGGAFDPLHIHCTWGSSPLHVSVQWGGGSKMVTFVECRVSRGTPPSNVQYIGGGWFRESVIMVDFACNV